jgi:hypothetical protein
MAATNKCLAQSAINTGALDNPDACALAPL